MGVEAVKMGWQVAMRIFLRRTGKPTALSGSVWGNLMGEAGLWVY